ncbi:MAG TPA: PfkB family carbohydrate kinase [Bryobacteraceae bacterium]|nr:PfkB family carbohydrate kinase [Bryobacteraceae bacterium]
MAAAPGCAFFGRSTLDLLYHVPAFPPEDSKTMAVDFLAQAGGPALNAAITFAFLGGEAYWIAAIGRGKWAAIVKRELRQYGVALLDMCGREDFSPPVSSIVVNANSGSRTVFNSRAGLPAPTVPVPCPTQPMLLVDGIDTLAAGDILRGAPRSYFLRTQDFEKALRSAARVATLSVGFFGARA